MRYELISQTKLAKGGIIMTKRKVAHDAALHNNKTPTESMENVELTDETKNREDMQRAANRNSKQGRKGKSDL